MFWATIGSICKASAWLARFEKIVNQKQSCGRNYFVSCILPFSQFICSNRPSHIMGKWSILDLEWLVMRNLSLIAILLTTALWCAFSIQNITTRINDKRWSRCMKCEGFHFVVRGTNKTCVKRRYGKTDLTYPQKRWVD